MAETTSTVWSRRARGFGSLLHSTSIVRLRTEPADRVSILAHPKRVVCSFPETVFFARIWTFRFFVSI
jgi:hypothetical protein